MLLTKVVENQNTHFVFNFFFENHAVYEIMWKKKVLEPDRPKKNDNVRRRRKDAICMSDNYGKGIQPHS